MTNFEKCIDFILKHEGGYVNHPSDPGGETNFGIAKKFYPDLDIKNLTVKQAKEIYYKEYWLKLKCDELPLPVAAMVFDAGVNQGLVASAKILQRSLKVTDDGVIGKKTIEAIMSTTPGQLLPEMCARRCQYYASIKNVDTFGLGWMRRAVGCFDFALSLR